MYGNWEAEELIKTCHEYTKKVCASKETALAALVRAGLVTKDGKPTPHYAPREEPLDWSI